VTPMLEDVICWEAVTWRVWAAVTLPLRSLAPQSPRRSARAQPRRLWCPRLPGQDCYLLSCFRFGIEPIDLALAVKCDRVASLEWLQALQSNKGHGRWWP